MKISRSYFFYILVLLFIFYDEFFFFVLIATGTSHESGMKTFEAVPLAIATYLLMIYDLITKRINDRIMRVLQVLFIILVLYLITQLFYNSKTVHYRSALLFYGAASIPAAYLGAQLAQATHNSILKIDKLLPFFVIPISVLVGTVGMRYAIESMLMVGDDTGLSYQSISYLMAFCYTYCAYYVFFSPLQEQRIHRWFRLFLLPDMLFCALMCLVSGGRGAFVLITFVTLYIIFTLRKTLKGYFGQFVLTVLGVSVIFLALSSYLDVWESAGMSRIMNSLTTDEERMRLYNSAIDSFMESPLGHGVGSIWFTVGYYSHNMFLDWLVEVGLAGAVLFSILLYKTFIKLYRLMRYQKFAIFLTVVFLGALVNDTFSGYYLGAIKLFMVCSFAYVYRFESVKLRNNSREILPR